ncbi:MAG: glucosyltransferase domain-containing protein, partial [Candidatus Eremiobacterota bacterium]
NYPQTPMGLILGRIFQMLINGLYGLWIDNINDLKICRFISIVFIAISMAIFSTWLYRLFPDKKIAFLISASIFTLPSVQFYILFVNGSSLCMAIIFAIASFIAIEQVESFSIRSSGLIFISFLFLLISIFTYQIPPLFYLVPLLADILFNKNKPWSHIRLKTARSLLLFCSVLTAYFLILKSIVIPAVCKQYPFLYKHINESSIYRIKLSQNMSEKISFFIDQLSFNSLNLWNLYPSRTIPVIIIIFILIAIIVKLEKNKLFEQLQASIIIFIIILLGNSPNLVAAGGAPFYRTLFPYTSMIFLLIIWAVENISEKISERARHNSILYVTLFTMLTGAFTAQYNVTNDAINSQMELNYLRASIMPYKNKNLTAIHVIRSADEVSFTGLPARYDEFNFCSTHEDQNIRLMIETFLKDNVEEENGIIVKDKLPAITSSNLNYPFIYTQEDGIIINMNDLLYPVTKNHIADPSGKIVKVETSVASTDYRYSGVCVFDSNNINYPGTFWESSGYPQWLEIDYEKGNTIKTYSIKAGTLPERAPKSWLFQYSDDNLTWFTIDTRTNETDWTNEEERSFVVKQASNHKYYRWFFSKGNDNILRIEEIKFYINNE